MRIGYARVSKAHDSQSLDLQRYALRGQGHRRPSQPLPRFRFRWSRRLARTRQLFARPEGGRRAGDLETRPTPRPSGPHRADLPARGAGLRVLAGQGAQIDTTTAVGRLVFGIFAALAEFKRELIRERTLAGVGAG